MSVNIYIWGLLDKGGFNMEMNLKNSIGITDFRNKLSEIVGGLKDGGKKVIISNNKPKAVICDYEEFEILSDAYEDYQDMLLVLEAQEVLAKATDDDYVKYDPDTFISSI